MPVSGSTFRKAKSVAKKRQSEKEKILLALLFSAFYNEAPSWKQSVRKMTFALYPTYTKYALGEMSCEKDTVLIANTKDAIHYQRISNSISHLFEEFRIQTIGLDKEWTKVSTSRHIYCILSFIPFLMWLIARIRPAYWAEWSYIMRVMPRLLKKYEEVKLNYTNLKENMSKINGVVVINEEWLPSSALIKYAKKEGVKTVHYPHGNIGNINTPLLSDVQLMWNTQMKENFSKNKTSYCIGFLEMYKRKIKKKEEDIDLVVTSQVHGRKVNGESKFTEIFRVLSKMDGCKNIAIKMHPFDGKEDRTIVESIMSRGECEYEILSGGYPLEEILSRTSFHATVSSGSVVTASKMGVTNLLYGQRDNQLKLNGLAQRARIFDSINRLKKIMNKKSKKYRTEWLKESYTEKGFKVFIDSEF